MFYKNEQGYFPGSISDDGKWVALTKVNTTSDSDIYLWNVDTKETTHLSPHKGSASYSPSSFDRTSTHLYYLTDDGSEFARLRRYDLAKKTHEDVQKADVGHRLHVVLANGPVSRHRRERRRPRRRSRLSRRRRTRP